MSLTPMHERPEYIALRDAMAKQLDAYIEYPLNALGVANAIAPVAYLAVEQQCVQWQRASVETADTLVMVISRIERMQQLIEAAQEWRKSPTIEYLAANHESKLSPSERKLIAAVNVHNKRIS